MKYTKLKAINELLEHDHAFLSPEGVKNIGEPLGIYQTRKVKDTRSQFKGLDCSTSGYKEGDVVEGLDAHILAMMICKKEGVEYQDYFGIGSQLRECCRAMIDHLTKGAINETT